MNFNIYIFGELQHGYTQYPEDSSSNLIRSVINQNNSPSQLIIHRDDNLMYYIYVRKFEDKKYIGFALTINGYYLTQISNLFKCFENEIEKIIEEGIFLYLTSNGNIDTKLSIFTNEEEETQRIIYELQDRISLIGKEKPLPNEDYSVSISSKKIFQITDNETELIKASYTYGYVIILKEDDYDSVRLNSYRNVLKNINKEKQELIKQINELREKNRKIQRQKKQFRNIIILIFVILGCGLGLILLSTTLSDKKAELEAANNTIIDRNTTIVNKDNEITTLNNSIVNLRKDLTKEQTQKKQFQSYLDSIAHYSPFYITDCQVKASHFIFRYISLEDKEITITLRIINENNGEIFTESYDLSLHKGEGKRELEYRRVLNSSFYYYVFMIWDGNIIAGRRW